MEPENDAHPPINELGTFAVNPARLAWGDATKEVCEGDIPASYSADVIATAGRVRKPFVWKGSLYVCTGIRGAVLSESHRQEFEAYRIVPLAAFTGGTTTYSGKTGTADAAEKARNDPTGFYHGMTINYGSRAFVLSGPPIRFVTATPERPADVSGDEPLQLTLF
jgi:hypothetical protein